MTFRKLLLAVAPWLAFLVIAHGGLTRLKIGLAVAPRRQSQAQAEAGR